MEFKPHTWWRFIHDIFIIGMGGEEKLRESLDYLNDSHDTISLLQNGPREIGVKNSMPHGLIVNQL